MPLVQPFIFLGEVVSWGAPKGQTGETLTICGFFVVCEGFMGWRGKVKCHCVFCLLLSGRQKTQYIRWGGMEGYTPPGGGRGVIKIKRSGVYGHGCLPPISKI